MVADLDKFGKENRLSHLAAWKKSEWVTDHDLDIIGQTLGITGQYLLIGNQAVGFQQMADSITPFQKDLIRYHIRSMFNPSTISTEMADQIRLLKQEIDIYTDLLAIINQSDLSIKLTRIDEIKLRVDGAMADNIKSLAKVIPKVLTKRKKQSAISPIEKTIENELVEKQFKITSEFNAILKTIDFQPEQIQSYIGSLVTKGYGDNLYGLYGLYQAIDIDKEAILPETRDMHFIINTGAREKFDTKTRIYSNEGSHYVRATLHIDKGDPLKARFDYDDSNGDAPRDQLVEDITGIFPNGFQVNHNKKKIQFDSISCGKYAMMSLHKKLNVVQREVGDQASSNPRQQLPARHSDHYIKKFDRAPSLSSTTEKVTSRPSVSPFKYSKTDDRLTTDLNYPNTNLYKTTDLYKTHDQDKSAIRVSKEITSTKQSDVKESEAITNQIVTNIKSAKDQLKSRPNIRSSSDQDINNFIMQVITFAQEYGGVGNAGADKWKDFQSKNTIVTAFSFDDAKQFSFHYQNAAQISGIYTGREADLRTDKIIGARLKRIPKELNQQIGQDLGSTISSSFVGKR